MAESGFINFNPKKVTVWWEPHRPNMIKVCIDDAWFVNDDGQKPGLWLPIRRSDPNNWNRLARALHEAGRPAPPLEP